MEARHFSYSGRKKQQREDVSSDGESYAGLDDNYKRRRIMTDTPRQPSLLRHGVEMVDFDTLASTTRWGKTLLFGGGGGRGGGGLGDADVAALVGLATTYDDDDDHDDDDDDHHDDDDGVDHRDHLDAFQDPRKHNPLRQIPYGSPLPPSFLAYIQFRASLNLEREQQERDRSGRPATMDRLLQKSLGDSAAVATGMALEEILTASLLPLAGLHVVRCRELEDLAVPADDDDGEDVGKDNNARVPSSSAAANLHTSHKALAHPVTGERIDVDTRRIKWRDETSWEEWTLPPEEAILKLLEQGMISEGGCHFVSGAATAAAAAAAAPSRSLVNTTTNTTAAAAVTTTAATTAKANMQMWGKRYNIDPKVVAANGEIIRIFMTPHDQV